MVTAARARQVLQEGTIAGHRAARMPVRGARRHAVPTTAQDITNRQLLMLVTQGTAVGLAVLAVLAAVWFFFGDHLRSRFTTLGAAPVGAAASGPAAPGPTVFYRERGDGRVLVMEIDATGTRIRGTIDRTDVPMLQEVPTMRNKWDVDGTSAQTRMNALGSSFR